MLFRMAYPCIHLLCSRFVGILGGWCHFVSHWHSAWLLSLDSIGEVMTDADKKYMAYDKPEEEHPDPYEFLGQQIKGIVVWIIFVVGASMLVAAVFK
jgi:hypothetical protein